MSVLNIKKSSARFLSPIGQNEQPPGAIHHNKVPSSLIDKYPNGAKPDNPMNMPPRTIRETKNNQMFEKFMNRQTQNRKGSLEQQQTAEIIPASMNPIVSDFALPSLGGGVSSHASVNRREAQGPTGQNGAPPAISQMSNGRGNVPNAAGFSSRNRKDPAVRASLSDSDFDF